MKMILTAGKSKQKIIKIHHSQEQASTNLSR